MRELRIVFMGTPEFAVDSLKALLKANFNIVGVVTTPDKPAGRGRKLKQSAVKEFAISKNLTILQPMNLKSEDFINELKYLKVNLQIVVAFRMLPNIIWKLPEYGTFNLHASLLPNYRGAAPINWAIINGETKTGVTTFFIDDKIDTGAIILSKEIKISETDTLGVLHDKLMELGSKLVVETVRLIQKNKVKTIQQPKKETKPAPKIYTEICKINWEENLENIYNLIRGLNPFPGAWTILRNNQEEIIVKIFDIRKEFIPHNFETGLVISTKKEIKIATKNGFLIIDSLQLSGKRKMDTKSLLNGYTFENNSIMR